MKVDYSPGSMTSQDLSKVYISYFGNNCYIYTQDMAKFIVFALLSYQLLLPDNFNGNRLYSYNSFLFTNTTCFSDPAL